MRDQAGSARPARKRYVYPDLVFNALALAYLLLGLLLTLAILHPFELGQAADPLTEPEVIKPEWYFLAFYQFVNYLPRSLGSGLVFLGLLLLFLLPFVSSPLPAKVRRRLLPALGSVFVVFYLLLTLIGYLAETERTLFGHRYRFDTRGIPHRVEASAQPPTSGASRGGGQR